MMKKKCLSPTLARFECFNSDIKNRNIIMERKFGEIWFFCATFWNPFSFISIWWIPPGIRKSLDNFFCFSLISQKWFKIFKIEEFPSYKKNSFMCKFKFIIFYRKITKNFSVANLCIFILSFWELNKMITMKKNSKILITFFPGFLVLFLFSFRIVKKQPLGKSTKKKEFSR